MTIAILDFLRTRALSRGIPEPEVLALWAQHTVWCDGRGEEYGGRPWDALLDTVVKRLKDQRVLDQKTEEWAEQRAKKLAAEARAKAQADAEYALTAVSLTAWIASLREQAEGGDLLTPLEASLAKAPPPTERDSALWLANTLAKVRRFDGAPLERENSCPEPGCGLPVTSWTAPTGVRHRGSRCSDHEGLVRP